ncbi:MAG: hypothetical protein RLZZ416_627 [Candidatus Parcubacteria bacterium]|jgi:hypothetical protein
MKKNLLVLAILAGLLLCIAVFEILRAPRAPQIHISYPFAGQTTASTTFEITGIAESQAFDNQEGGVYVRVTDGTIPIEGDVTIWEGIAPRGAQYQANGYYTFSIDADLTGYTGPASIVVGPLKDGLPMIPPVPVTIIRSERTPDE